MGRPTAMAPPGYGVNPYQSRVQQSGFGRKGQPTGPPGVTGGRPAEGFGMLDAYRQAAQQRLGPQPGLQPYQGALATQRGQPATPIPYGGRKGGATQPPPVMVPPSRGQWRDNQPVKPSAEHIAMALRQRIR